MGWPRALRRSAWSWCFLVMGTSTMNWVLVKVRHCYRTIT